MGSVNHRKLDIVLVSNSVHPYLYRSKCVCACVRVRVYTGQHSSGSTESAISLLLYSLDAFLFLHMHVYVNADLVWVCVCVHVLVQLVTPVIVCFQLGLQTTECRRWIIDPQLLQSRERAFSLETHTQTHQSKRRSYIFSQSSRLVACLNMLSVRCDDL